MKGTKLRVIPGSGRDPLKEGPVPVANRVAPHVPGGAVGRAVPGTRGAVVDCKALMEMKIKASKIEILTESCLAHTASSCAVAHKCGWLWVCRYRHLSGMHYRRIRL